LRDGAVTFRLGGDNVEAEVRDGLGSRVGSYKRSN